ncbi:hypothetical protein [Mucilaginibacter sp.]|uniref:hypothetical protein n=1 Tax=Mucilaginibacter sp. TaxID=1882438 RepID=UPI0025FB9A3D|nr:hypothetical protein [Mucilaginibacter sp.]
MSKSTTTNASLNITINPGTVYISTNPDQSSYANLVVTVENTGQDSLSVNEIAITLPPVLAPANSLNSITPVAAQASLWNFRASQFTSGEFDATAVSGNDVQMNAGDIWQFTLQNVTLTNSTAVPSADVDVVVTFGDATSFPKSLNVNIDAAVASIISFNSQPANITPGGLTALSWQCEKITYCVITPISDKQLASSGSLNVKPNSTTVYTLYAYGDGVILSAQWAVSVANAQVINFGVNGQTNIDLGGTVNLVWACNQFTENIAIIANSGVTIPPLNTGGNTHVKGSVSVGPITAPTTFTLYAYGSTHENFNTSTAVISINNVTVTLSATPGSGLWVGDAITFNWAITNALSVNFTPAVTNGPSLQNLSGSAVYDPPIGVTSLPCTLTVTGFGNDYPVTITNNPPIVLAFEPVTFNSFTISPQLIIPQTGPNQATLAWNTQAQLVTINDGVGTVNANGSTVVNSPANGSVITLTAGTNQHPGLLTQTVNVVNAYGPFTFTQFTWPAIAPFGVLKIATAINCPDIVSFIPYKFMIPLQITVTGLTSAGQQWGQNISGVTVMPFGGGWWFVLPLTPVAWADPNNPTGTVTIIGID